MLGMSLASRLLPPPGAAEGEHERGRDRSDSSGGDGTTHAADCREVPVDRVSLVDQLVERGDNITTLGLAVRQHP